MSASTVMLRLPPRRLDQLKNLSAVLNLSLADTIGHLIRKEIVAGAIPADIPGITVKRVGADKVAVTVDNNPTANFTLKDALYLAQSLRDVAKGELYSFAPVQGFSVARQGGGIRFAVPFGATAIMLSPDLARDLADQIEKAAI